jgi:hypothetical protein
METIVVLRILRHRYIRAAVSGTCTCTTALQSRFLLAASQRDSHPLERANTYIQRFFLVGEGKGRQRMAQRSLPFSRHTLIP